MNGVESLKDKGMNRSNTVGTEVLSSLLPNQKRGTERYVRALFRSKAEGFVPHTQHVNFRIVCQKSLARRTVYADQGQLGQDVPASG